jgi:DUF4097 and DUF4098 domain-containing protein YvlB
MGVNEFSVDGRPELTVSIQSGRIELAEGADAAVRVTVDTQDPDFTVEQRGNQIIVSSGRAPRRWSAPPAYIVVETPPGSDLQVQTASANVDSRVALRRVEVKSASGNIDVGDVETLTVKTASGDVNLASSDGPVRVTSASGDLRSTGRLHGSVVMSTVSGDITIADSDASLDVKSVSGDVIVTRYVGRNANFRTVSGSAEFGVPAGTKLHLDADLRTGKVIYPSTPPPTKEVLREMSVRARSISGDLKINRVAG